MHHPIRQQQVLLLLHDKHSNAITFLVVHQENQVGQILNEFWQLFEIFGVLRNTPYKVGHVDVVNLKTDERK